MGTDNTAICREEAQTGSRGAITEAREREKNTAKTKKKERIVFFLTKKPFFRHQALATVASAGLSDRPWTTCGQEELLTQLNTKL